MVGSKDMVCKRPCKIQCTFDHLTTALQNVLHHFCVYWTPTLRLKLLQRTQLSAGVGGWFWFSDFHLENLVFVLKK